MTRTNLYIAHDSLRKLKDVHEEIRRRGASGAKAAGILNCDLDDIRRSRRIPKSIKDDHDLLVYLVWKRCLLPNEETGRLFGPNP